MSWMREMTEHMTIEEINDRFKSEWVLVSNPDVNESFEILGGEVLFHSKNRDEVDREMLQLRPKALATLYTGQIPEDAAVIL